MLKRVLKTIARYGMLDNPMPVMAAVSGGADSVCLLHVLLEIGANLVGVVHVNHKLRAAESDADERLVCALAEKLRLPFYTTEARIDAGNLEQAARLKRRQFFEQLISQGVATKIALGHTRDDQAETVLFRLLRGSGLSGLAGIHPVTPNGLIRPLIGVAHAEILEYLRGRGLPWREDASNADLRFARNRIRHQLLPQLARDWNPNIADTLAQLGALAFEEERYWEETLPVASVELSARSLQAMPRAAARRIVRRAIQAAKGDLKRIEFQHIERVLDMKSRRAILPGLEVTRYRDGIHFTRTGSAESQKRDRNAVLT